MVDDCIFCKIVKGEIPSEKVYEDDNFIGFLDINPEVKGHTLVIPKKHFKTLLDMPSSLGNEMLEAIKKISLELIDKQKSGGVNVVFNINKIAGQEVDHVHAHILPREKGDGIRLIANGLRDKKD
jgi:histidine triad (HIT) family protein